MTDTAQYWQDRLMSEVVSSRGDFDKTFILPRGSGVTYFVRKLASELSVLTAGTDTTVVVLVRTRFERAQITSYLSGGLFLRPSVNVIVFAKEDPNDARGKIPTAHIDWLISDNVHDGEVYDEVNLRHINNSLFFYSE
jgi:hypothetical protein